MRVFGQWRSWDDAARSLPPDASGRLVEAYVYADRYHGAQTRPAGEPYVRHLLEVVEILATRLQVTDPDLLAAGLLHDVVEDTDGTIDEIADRFGARTAELVEHVTMRPGQDKAAARRAYLDRLRLAPPDVLRLKLADRYSNVQRLHTHPRVAKQRSYYAETVEHFVPLTDVDARLAELFGTWSDAYAYLDGAVDTPEAADKLAAAVHREQVDKSGAPYVEHSRAAARIAKERGASAHQVMAGLLHDSVEDTSCTLEQLRELGVPGPVVAMVDALSHRPGETQEDYLARLAKTPDAVLVKRSDIAHNSSPARLARLDRETQDRLRHKYETALRLLDSLA